MLLMAIFSLGHLPKNLTPNIVTMGVMASTYKFGGEIFNL
jgi:hypothetical protein